MFYSDLPFMDAGGVDKTIPKVAAHLHIAASRGLEASQPHLR